MSGPGGELFKYFLSRRRLSTTMPMAKRTNITQIAALTTSMVTGRRSVYPRCGDNCAITPAA